MHLLEHFVFAELYFYVAQDKRRGKRYRQYLRSVVHPFSASLSRRLQSPSHLHGVYNAIERVQITLHSRNTRKQAHEQRKYDDDISRRDAKTFLAQDKT